MKRRNVWLFLPLFFSLLALSVVGLAGAAQVTPQDVTPAGPNWLISTAVTHNCALRPYGGVECWGSEGTARSGDVYGSYTQVYHTQVDVGSNDSCALRTTGQIDCWGDTPYWNIIPSAGVYLQVSVGLNHVCALRPDGDVQCWGYNGYGQAAYQAGEYVQVSAGWTHTCALTSAGAVDCWGGDPSGLGFVVDRPGPYVQVAVGQYHNCALTSLGAVECWGSNTFGKAGDHPGPYTLVSAGVDHTCALTPTGAAECWGRYPATQPGPFLQVSAAFSHTCALTLAGDIDCWGNSNNSTADLDRPGPFGAFVEPADLTIKKGIYGVSTNPYDRYDWSTDFTGDLGAFSLTRDEPIIAYMDLAPGTYNVSELVQPGWPTTVECSDGHLSSTGEAAITAPGNDGLICYFITEAEPVTVTIESEVVGMPAGTPWEFDFSSPGVLGFFTLTDAEPGISFEELEAGEFRLNIQTLTGFIRSVSCDNGQSTASSSLDIRVDPGEHVTCTYSHVYDGEPPETVITSGPPPLTNSTTATIEFSSEPDATFKCGLAGDAMLSCTSPLILTGLTDATRTYHVIATDKAGNVDPTPASHSWTVDATPPQTTLHSGPSNPTFSSNASFTFSSQTGATLACRLDGGEWEACTSPKAYAGLADGSHTFEVRASDAAGNVDATPAQHVWTIDTTQPETTLLTTPPNPSSSSEATFTFSSSDPGATFICWLDGGSTGICTSPKTYTGLSNGNHVFNVRAVDAVGNQDPTAASYSWTIDTTPPNQPPNAPANPSPANGAADVAVTANLGWTGSDPDSDPLTYEVRFGASNPPPTVVSSQSATGYDPPGNLAHSTTYYWQIVANDGNGGTTPGPVWSFTTAAAPTFPNVFYISLSGNATIGGIAAQGADILGYNQAANAWTMVYDGSVRGTAKNISAFHIMDDGSLLLVFGANQTIDGLGKATPYDVVKFTPNTPGVFPLGAGVYSWFFQGRLKGLTTTGEKIDALDLVGNRLLLSTTAAASVPKPGGGALKAADEDVFAYDLAQSQWESVLVIDGSKMPGMATEDISGLWDDPQSDDYYISIVGAFNLGSVSGNDKSIVKLTPNGGATVYTPSLVTWLAPGASFTGKIDGLQLAD